MAHKAYVEQLRGLLEKSQAAIAVAPLEFLSFLREAAQGLGLALVGGPETFDKLPKLDSELLPLQSGETAYLQYTSGSTRFPRGSWSARRLSCIISPALSKTA